MNYNKTIVFVFIVLALTSPVYAQQNFAFTFNTGYLGLGANIPFNNNYDGEVYFSAPNIGFEYTPNNIGLELSPYNFFYWANSKKYGKNISITAQSFFNLKFYWNVITFLDDSFFIGPYTSVNYLFFNKTLDMTQYSFAAGIHLGYRLKLGRQNYNFFTSETGYRLINGKSSYFICAKVDVLSLIFMILFDKIS